MLYIAAFYRNYLRLAVRELCTSFEGIVESVRKYRAYIDRRDIFINYALKTQFCANVLCGFGLIGKNSIHNSISRGKFPARSCLSERYGADIVLCFVIFSAVKQSLNAEQMIFIVVAEVAKLVIELIGFL